MKTAVLLTGLILMGSLAFAQGAGAQEAGAEAASDRDEEARMSFELARRRYERGEFREAAEAFERSHELSPHPELLYNAYLGYRDANDDANAARTLRSYLDEVEETREPRVVLQQRLVALEANLEDPTEPGERVGVGAAADAPEESGGPPLGALVLTSVGAAAVIAGVVTGIVTGGIHSDIEAECPNQTCADLAAQQDDIDRGRRFARTTDALLFGGGALLVGGVVWWLLGGSKDDNSSADRTNIRALCVGTGCELGLGGSF